MTAAGARVACLDVGGTAIKSGVLEAAEPGRLRAAGSVPTPSAGDTIGERVVARVAEITRSLIEETGPVDAVGLVVPGLVDVASGTAVWSENLGWRDVPMRAMLEEIVGLPVAFGHDVRAGALAEARLGAGSGYGDMVFVPVGTGVAAAMVCAGTVFDRPRPTGELGHLDVGGPERCVCGLTGCLEAVASAAAIARRYSRRARRSATATEVAALVSVGDEDARVVWEEAVEALARGVAILAALLAPEAVVVGGGLAAAGDLLLVPLRAEVERRLSFHHRPVIVPAGLGDRAGCLGAGLLALELVQAGR